MQVESVVSPVDDGITLGQFVQGVDDIAVSMIKDAEDTRLGGPCIHDYMDVFSMEEECSQNRCRVGGLSWPPSSISSISRSSSSGLSSRASCFFLCPFVRALICWGG